jgi:hypothetical protein
MTRFNPSLSKLWRHRAARLQVHRIIHRGGEVVLNDDAWILSGFTFTFSLSASVNCAKQLL